MLFALSGSKPTTNDPVTRILIIKIGALGDVLRTTSILPGLHEAHPGAHIEWVTAASAEELVTGNPLVAKTHLVDPNSASEFRALGDKLAEETWQWVISLDDEALSCALATQVGTEKCSGAFAKDDGQLFYTDDVAPWFDMGLMSRRGKEVADRMKVENQRSHAEIYAQMLGIPMGRPALELPQELLQRAASQLAGTSRESSKRLIGLNTAAAGRWTSKALPPERVVEFAARLHHELDGEVTFVLLGGRDEAPRNAGLLAQLRGHPEGLDVIDGGTENSTLEFAALIDGLDLLLTSDSLALHIGVARNTPIVAFFAPTSAAEIELYGLGHKVMSQSADYCSFRPDADNRTITAERLVDAVCDVLRDHRS